MIIDPLHIPAEFIRDSYWCLQHQVATVETLFIVIMKRLLENINIFYTHVEGQPLESKPCLLSSSTMVAGGWPFNSTNRNRHSYFPFAF